MSHEIPRVLADDYINGKVDSYHGMVVVTNHAHQL